MISGTTWEHAHKWLVKIDITLLATDWFLALLTTPYSLLSTHYSKSTSSLAPLQHSISIPHNSFIVSLNSLNSTHRLGASLSLTGRNLEKLEDTASKWAPRAPVQSTSAVLSYSSSLNVPTSTLQVWGKSLCHPGRCQQWGGLLQVLNGLY